MDQETIKYKLQSVKKFYFLEYFYLLLHCVKNYYNETDIIYNFIKLKNKFQLGESKYKKISTIDEKNIVIGNVRYEYTLKQVIEESLAYNLIKESQEIFATSLYSLTEVGESLLKLYEGGNTHEFNSKLFTMMEANYNAFNYLIKFLYQNNSNHNGLLIFPVYSPLKLKMKKNQIKLGLDIQNYLKLLNDQIQKDALLYLGKKLSQIKDFDKTNNLILETLIYSNLITRDLTKEFEPKNYNIIVKKIRNYWINYFLKNIYNFEFSFTSFEIWMYRGKQFGVLNATEFYPYFNGKIVYPISILTNTCKNKDFVELYKYQHDKLFIHYPNWDTNHENFVKVLTESYFDLKKKLYRNNYFINLSALREVVCFKLKLSQYHFDVFLEKAYLLSLKRILKINISLEIDKLPQETNAVYLIREPVMVDGKYRNIIAIDII